MQQKFTKQLSWKSKIGYFLVFFSFLSITCLSQDITSGTIQGTVYDDQGAIVPGAAVEAKNVGTNYSKTFTTDSDGRFTFLSMPPGRYVVSVTKQGFAKLNQENVDLTVGRLISRDGLMMASLGVERAAGIEPAWPVWKTGTLPLSYARNRRPLYRPVLPCQFPAV